MTPDLFRLGILLSAVSILPITTKEFSVYYRSLFHNLKV
jgi:accessory gene regulator protein AgrB